MRMLFIVIASALLIFTLPLATDAAEYEYAWGEESEIYPEAEMESLMESLPEEVKAELQDYLSADNNTDRLAGLESKLDVRYWLGYIADHLREMLLPAGVGFAGLLGVVILSSILKNMLDGGLSGRLGGFCTYIITLSVAVSVAGISLGAVETAVGFIGRICALMNTMLPAMNAIMLASGSVTQMGISSTAMMIFITVIENLMNGFFVPLSGGLFALSTMSGVLRGINIGSFIGTLRRIIMRVFSFCLMIFSFILGIQTSLAGSADSLAMRTVRFAIGTYVPIVGGAVSESIGMVRAGLSHVKALAGTLGIVLILLTVLPPLISLTLSRLTLSLSHSAAELLECDHVAGIISEADSVLSVFVAVSALTSVFFVFAVVLFMNTGVSV